MCTHVGLLQQLCPLSHTSCAWFEIGALTEWEFRSLFPATLLELTEDDDQHFSKDGMYCTLTHTYLIKEILAFCPKTTGKSGSNTSWAMEQWSNFPYCHLLSIDVFYLCGIIMENLPQVGSILFIHTEPATYDLLMWRTRPACVPGRSF